MATTIVTKSGSGAPTASDLVAGELAVDLTNGRLYTEDSGGTVLELGLNPNGNVNVTGSVTMDALTVSSDTNGDPVLAHFYNVSTGAAAEATAYITNSATSSDGLFLQAVGSSFTTTGGFVQDAAVLGSGTGASGGLSLMTRANADMRFYTNGHTNERMRIDYSGNLLVGKTATNYAAEGVEIRSNEVLITKAGLNPLSVRNNGNGGIISLNSGGTTVGTIGTEGNDLNIGNGDAGLQFIDGTQSVRPFNMTTNARIDAQVDLGMSSTRFKDLYLSDGVQNITASGVATGTLISAITGVTNGFQISANTSNEMTYDFNTGAGLKMRFTNDGNLLVGRTSDGATGNGHSIRGGNSAIFSRDSSGESMIIARNASAGDLVRFYCNGIDRGSINFDGGNTISYTSSSDRRLKENIADADDAGSKIDAIQVRKFDWKADGSHQDYGMVAQELLEVAPEAVSQGETEDDMMGVDYSKLVPMMLKEIQSLRARIAALES